MDDYRKALAAYLAPEDRTQETLANSVGCSQAAINRYVNGIRFPDAAIAREIDKATAGFVPFAVWQRVATVRMLGTPTPEALPDRANAA
ncbi:helix-turn-helix domain-containing protein [Sphingomonas soli]|uniref:helix-turn-helix domain-containing protein n=1 Tax=Sphingomonas soli TaxID=266127 RepID=UPI000834FD4B|nr:helix-turn-helix transcriptional regulator [Sphingomonas soli]